MSDKKTALQLRHDTATKGRVKGVRTQTAISVRMDNEVLEKVRLEANATGVTANRLINQACSFYIDSLDEERRQKACPQLPKVDKSEEGDVLIKYIHTTMGAEKWKEFCFMARALNLSVNKSIVEGLRLWMRKYSDSPFSLL